jgi:hypothetical protein
LDENQTAQMTSSAKDQVATTSLTVAEKLLAVYEDSGFEVHTGWNPIHVDNWRDAQFTNLKRHGRPVSTGGGGLSWHEIPCLELLSFCFSPERILIIGNSFGWSTLLMSLLWPNAEVVAMDVGMQPPADAAQKIVATILRRLRRDEPVLNPNPVYGIELTNMLAQKNHFKVRAVLSTSPQDVGWVVEKHLGGGPDFVLIDGDHSVAQLLLDFEACHKVAAKNCVYLFHDVINWELRGGFEVCQKRTGMHGGILWRTPSGMGLLYPEGRTELKRVFRAFGDEEAEMESVKTKLPGWRRAAWFDRVVCNNRLLKKVKHFFFRGGRPSPPEVASR